MLLDGRLCFASPCEKGDVSSIPCLEIGCSRDCAAGGKLVVSSSERRFAAASLPPTRSPALSVDAAEAWATYKARGWLSRSRTAQCCSLKRPVDINGPLLSVNQSN